MAKRVIVAIDGPAGAGKSTIARRVADKLGFLYIDTGAMYRAVALWAARAGVDPTDMHKLEQLAQEARIDFEPGGTGLMLNGEEISDAIRSREISALASRVSSIAGVRRALVEKQRQMAGVASVVMEGRDIGTVVFPEAQVKVFLDARSNVRAGRRATEKSGDPQHVESEIAERDARDRTRAEAPLMQAPDAIYLDTSELSLDDVENAVLKIVRDKTANGKDYQR